MRPKVLVLTTTLPATPGDGTPEFVLSLARSMADRYEITILAPRVRGGPPSERVDGVTIERFPYFPRRWEGLADGAILPNLESQRWRWVEAPFLIASFWWHASRLAARIRPQVVHAHWTIPAGLVARMIKATTAIPYVLTVHGGDAYALRASPLRWVKRQILMGAHTVSPVSHDLAAHLASTGSPSPLPVVPMGVDVEAIQNGLGERSPERGRFLFIGRLVDKKGVDVLVRAMREVPEATLVVVGDGPERASLEALADQVEVRPRIRFAGRMTQAGVMEELHRAYALVIPSRVAESGDQEGTPLVMAEGMAAGVPVIASRLGGLAEHIEPGVSGLLVEPGSVSDLARALGEAMSDPQALDAYQARAKDLVKSTLDISNTSGRYQGFLEAAMRAAADKPTRSSRDAS